MPLVSVGLDMYHPCILIAGWRLWKAQSIHLWLHHHHQPFSLPSKWHRGLHLQQQMEVIERDAAEMLGMRTSRCACHLINLAITDLLPPCAFTEGEGIKQLPLRNAPSEADWQLLEDAVNLLGCVNSLLLEMEESVGSLCNSIDSTDVVDPGCAPWSDQGECGRGEQTHVPPRLHTSIRELEHLPGHGCNNSLGQVPSISHR